MWRTMTAVWPDYDSYQEKTDREIPVVCSSGSSPRAGSARPAFEAAMDAGRAA